MSTRTLNLLAAALVALALCSSTSVASPSPIGDALYVTVARGGHAVAPATHGIGTAVLNSTDCRVGS